MMSEITLEEPPCAICGARDAAPLYTKHGLFIARCRRCALTYASPRLPKDYIWLRYGRDYFWNEYLPSFGIRDDQIDLASSGRPFRPMVRLMTRCAGRPGRVLEVGTGAGLFLKVAELAGWEVAGLDLSEDAVSFARDRLGLDVRRESAEHMTFPRESFDVAVLLDTIEHLLDPASVLQSVRAALKPSGLLIIKTPNLDALSHAILGLEWASLSPAEHLYYFTESTLRVLLERGGWEAVAFKRHCDTRPRDSMNGKYSHAPESRRAVYYQLGVRTFGWVAAPVVRALGMADALVCLARKP